MSNSFFSSRRPLRRITAVLGLSVALNVSAAAPAPISTQDLCLMIRSGYSDADVLRETAARPLLEPLTPAAEQALRTAGADQALIDALKNNRRTASPAEALAARQQQAEAEQRAAAAASQQAALLRSQQALRPAPPAGNNPQEGDPHMMEKLLHGKLVVFRDEKIVPADSSALEGKKLYGIYLSRLASRGGGTFTSDLAQFYRSVTPKHPEFEVVLISGDPSLYSMENFMRQVHMPWLAVAWDQNAQTPLYRLQENNGTSRLIVTDNFGRMLADYHISAENGNLAQVLPDLAKLIANPGQLSALAPPAPSRPAPVPAVRPTQ